MGIVEIVLIIAGAIICILGYLMPSRKEDMDETLQLISEDEVRKVVDKEIDAAKSHITDIVDETVTYAMEKTERSMERVTNEKIMAVNEYSDTVLEEINKNHKEVLFLYDMLNDKHDNLKETVSEASKTAEEIRQTVRDAEITAKETQESVKSVEDSVRNMEDSVREAEEAARNAAKNAVSAVQEALSEGRNETERPMEEKRSYERGTEAVDIDMPAGEAEPAASDGTEINRGTIYEGMSDAEETGAESFTGEPEDTTDSIYAEMQQMLADMEDHFVPIKPPRVEIIHDPDSEYDYVAETPQRNEMPEPAEMPVETKPLNIRFTNGKNNGRNSNERILELHKAGKSNMAIAKELGLGIGEVKLVIDLFEGF